MDAKQAIRSQYLAALEMLKQVIVQCPEALWDAPDDKNRFWRIAYHALFYTHLYLQTSESEFTAWSGHREGYHRLESLPQPTPEQPDLGKAYSKRRRAGLPATMQRTGYGKGRRTGFGGCHLRLLMAAIRQAGAAVLQSAASSTAYWGVGGTVVDARGSGSRLGRKNE